MSNLLLVIWPSLLSLILGIIHFAYSVFEYFDLGWIVFKRKLFNVMNFQSLDTHSNVSKFVDQLEKCPSHFAVIVGSEGIEVKDFSNLVNWCLAARISFVSFYDYSGHLKANKSFYYKSLLRSTNVDSRSIVFDGEGGGLKNGVSRKIHVKVLSLEDGKEALVGIARRLGEKGGEIDERVISEELFSVMGVPEPELGLVCGPVFATFGFLPWHIRVTEFLHLRSIKDITVTEFKNILKSYSSCIQRFGK